MNNSSKKTKKQGVHYCQRASPSWFDENDPDYKDWIQAITQNDFSVFDKACNTPISCDYFKDHAKSKKHLKNYNKWNELKATNTTLDSTITLGNKIIKLYCRIALFITKKNLPISSVSDIQELMALSFPTQKEVTTSFLTREKMVVVLNALANFTAQIYYSELKNTYYSLVYDESSIKTKKYASLIIRRTESDLSKVSTFVLAIIPMTQSTAEKIFQGYMKYIVNNNIENSLVGLGVDNANVMIGNNNSLKSKTIERKQNLVCVPCNLHIINLCEKKSFLIPSSRIHKSSEYDLCLF